MPAGPANPKGNGSLEGAFSQMKEVIGPIVLDSSSPRALAQSILKSLVSVYVRLRNKLSLRGESTTPETKMTTPQPVDAVEQQRQRIDNHVEAKYAGSDQRKVDRLNAMIKMMGIEAEEAVLKRAEKTICAYEMHTVIESEKAFVKAVNRKPERLNLAYFFGILRNKQQERDNHAYEEHCRKRYHFETLLNRRREEKQLENEPVTIEMVVGMLEKVVSDTLNSIKKMAFNRAREWTQELLKEQKAGQLKEKCVQVIGNVTHLDLEKKEAIWNCVEGLLNPKSREERVTLFL